MHGKAIEIINRMKKMADMSAMRYVLSFVGYQEYRDQRRKVAARLKQKRATVGCGSCTRM
jgi:hypothetical protein